MVHAARPPHPPTAKSSTVKSSIRTIELLELLSSASGTKSFTLAEVHRALPYPKSSLLELLRTLVQAGWVDYDDDIGRYGIGLGALLAGSSFLERDPVARFGGPLLRRLEQELDETVHLARLDRTNVVYLMSREAAHHARRTSRPGRRLPAFTCALGKALLAERTDAEALALLPAELVARTPHTIVDRDAILLELAATRARGSAREREENTPGLACVAVVVPHAGLAVDALSCSMPLDRFTPEAEQRALAALARAAAQLSELVELSSPSSPH